jgi:hypothetical protein
LSVRHFQVKHVTPGPAIYCGMSQVVFSTKLESTGASADTASLEGIEGPAAAVRLADC